MGYTCIQLTELGAEPFKILGPILKGLKGERLHVVERIEVCGNPLLENASMICFSP